MNKRIKTIQEVYKNFNENKFKKITVFTKCFNVTGEYHIYNQLNNLITLKNAKIYSYTSNSECNKIQWLNIFGKDIISFSFTAADDVSPCQDV